ncbi:MAG: hypothetical protein WDN08_10655 [Rhizomicrobium sp.]
MALTAHQGDGAVEGLVPVAVVAVTRAVETLPALRGRVRASAASREAMPLVSGGWAEDRSDFASLMAKK